jgi:SnoaL-like protein
MDAAEKLLAVEEIKTLKSRYFRYMDTKNWDGYRDLFAPDFAVVDEAGKPLMRGAVEFAENVKSYLGASVTMHTGHSPEIDILSATTAKGIWGVHDILTWEKGDPREGFKKIIGWGHYHETYRKLADGWRIETWRLTRTNLVQIK